MSGCMDGGEMDAWMVGWIDGWEDKWVDSADSSQAPTMCQAQC